MSLSGQQLRVQVETSKLTSLGNGNHIRHIGHENAAFELQLGVFVAWLGPCGLCLVLLVLGLGLHDLLAAEQNALEEIYLILKAKGSAKVNKAARTAHTNSYVFFLVSLASDDGVDSVKEQLAKLIHAVFLPVINARDQVFQCLVQESAVHCLVSPMQNALGGLDAGCEIRPRRFVLALLQQILGGVSWILACLATSGAAYLEQERVLDETLHGFQEETIQSVEVARNRVLSGLDLVERLAGQLASLSLVGDEGLITHVENLLVCSKRASPLLSRLRHRVRRLDPDEKLALAIQDGVDVEEDVVDDVAGNDAVLFQRLLQVVQVLQILDVFSLRVDQLAHNVVAVAHLGARFHHVVFGIRLDLEQQAPLLGKIENVIDDGGDLMFESTRLPTQIRATDGLP